MNRDLQDTDTNLIIRCRKGEARAQFILFRKYSKAMYNIAVRFTNNRMDAEDILQESFITAFERLQELENTASFPSWLKRIVVNRSVDHIRKKRLKFDDLDDSVADIQETGDEADLNIDPELIHEMIKNLPQGGRTVLVLHVLEGYKHREIAEMLGISESTSKSQYTRAIGLLYSNLKQKFYATEA